MKRTACLFFMLTLILLPLIPSLAQEGNWIVSNPHSTWVHLRQEPTTQSQSLGRYPNGTDVVILDETGNGWVQVAAEGKTGYMLKSMVTRLYSLADDTRIVGRTSDGLHIQACTAPNGQVLYFATLEKKPMIKMEDVNFDGVADVVVFVSMGASNGFCEFFISDGQQYHMADHPGLDYGLCNYSLIPEKKLVLTQANNGSAGALHEYCIFRWEGNDLKLVRRAVSEEWTQTEWLSDRFITTTHLDKLHATIRDYTQSEYEGTLIWEEISDMDESAIRQLLERENEALWDGLK